MDDRTFISQQVIDDFITVLKSKGIPDDKIQNFMYQVIAQTEIEVVREMVTKLNEEQKNQLRTMIEEGKTGDEIAKAMNFSEKEMSELEVKKFAEIMSSLMPVLEASN